MRKNGFPNLRIDAYKSKYEERKAMVKMVKIQPSLPADSCPEEIRIHDYFTKLNVY